MQTRPTLYLLFLNGLLWTLAAFLFWQKKDSEADEGDSALVPENFYERMESLSITSAAASESWLFERTAETWQLTEPLIWNANPFAVRQFVDELSRLKPLSTFSVQDIRKADLTLAEYNLQTPKLAIELVAGNQERLRFTIGIPERSSDKAYLRDLYTNQISVLPVHQAQFLNATLIDFLQPRIFTIPTEEVRALQVQDLANPAARVRLEKQGDGWKLISPIESDASTSEVLDLINRWNAFNVRAFVRDGLGEAFESNGIRLTMESAIRRESLIFSDTEARALAHAPVLARNEGNPSTFEVPRDLYKSLLSAQDALREKRVLSSIPENWNSLEIRMDGQLTTLQQLENGNWQVVFTDSSGELRSIPAEPVIQEELKESFALIEATRFVTDAPSDVDLLDFGILDPQRVVTFRFDGENQATFTIGNFVPRESLFYAQTSLSPTIFTVRPYVLSLLPLNPLHYRNRTIQTLPETATLGNIQLRNLDTEEILFDSSRGEYPGLLVQLNSFFRVSRFRDFIQEDFSNPLVLDPQTPIPFRYEIRAQVELPGTDNGEDPRRFLLSRPIGSDTIFVADPQTRLVGILPNTLARELIPLLRNNP